MGLAPQRTAEQHEHGAKLPGILAVAGRLRATGKIIWPYRHKVYLVGVFEYYA